MPSMEWFVRQIRWRSESSKQPPILGSGVPDDLLVVGYDDNHFASESSIPVSTVSLPGCRMGELAVELLLDEIREPAAHTHQTKILDPHLIPRRSSLRSPV